MLESSVCCHSKQTSGLFLSESSFVDGEEKLHTIAFYFMKMRLRRFRTFLHMPCHSIMKLASNNGQKLFFYPLIYGNHKSCGVICSLTKHLMNPVNALNESRIVNPIESNFIVNLIVLNLQKSFLN